MTLTMVTLGDAGIAWRTDGPGDGEPLLCIHGSWDDHHSWEGVTAELSDRFRVIRYDRRGHSASSAPPGQGRIGEDVADAIALLDHLGVGRAHVMGHSYGACVAVLMAATAPERVESLLVHEPPLFGMLTGDATALREAAAADMREAAALLRAGETEAGVRLFVERVGFGAGSWEILFDAKARATMLRNAGTWLDQHGDPDRLLVDVGALATFPRAIGFSTGSRTLPTYAEVTRRAAAILPGAAIHMIEEGGHGAHISHPRAVAVAFRRHAGIA